MKARPGPLLSNLTTFVVGVALALLICEGGVRILWSNAPASVAADTLPLQQVPDPEVLYRLIPGATGHFNGTEIQVNSMGLRDREYSMPAPKGTTRVLMLGDSMVFGIGLRPEQTLPGQLARMLAPAEVINGGIFGYNLTQEITLLRDIGLRYKPDIVISCFVHNDIENWGLGDGGAVPEIKSSRFDPPPADAWSSRLADLLLPDTFDADRLNVLPRAQERPGLRQSLATFSRFYLFVYLRLRTHSWNLTSGERRDPAIESPACQTERVIWEPLRQNYRIMKTMVERKGARLVVVIQGGLLWQGRPLVHLRRLLAEEGIPCLDLTPVWRDAAFYAKEYSLGWDPHPNARANAVAAGLVAAYLQRAGLLPERIGDGLLTGSRPPGPHDVIAARADLRDGLSEWESREARQAEREIDQWREQTAGFSSSIDLDNAGQRAMRRGQILYGFWDPAGAAPAEPGGGLWMSASAAVLLKPPTGARSITLDLSLPAGLSARERTPRSLLPVSYTHLTL